MGRSKSAEAAGVGAHVTGAHGALAGAGLVRGVTGGHGEEDRIGVVRLVLGSGEGLRLSPGLRCGGFPLWCRWWLKGEAGAPGQGNVAPVKRARVRQRLLIEAPEAVRVGSDGLPLWPAAI